MEVLVQLCIVSGHGLPKTDLISKIDPYVKISVGNTKFKTQVIQDNENPVWKEHFGFTCSLAPNGLPDARLEVELCDEDFLRNQSIGTATIHLASFHPSQLQSLQVPLQLKPKYQGQNRNSYLTISIVGWVATYEELKRRLKGVPGAIFKDKKQSLYNPVPNTNGLVFLGVEYDGPAVDFKVLVTQPEQYANVYVDLALSGRQHTKVRRKSFSKGEKVADGLVVFEEVKMDDVPLSADLSTLLVLCFDRQFLSRVSADVVVQAHNWRGALGFEEARRVLTDKECDEEKKEIYLSVEDPRVQPLETLLLVDYDEDDVDIKLGVLATGSNLTKGFDLTINSQVCKKTSEIFDPPKMVARGKYALARVFELDDVEYGTGFDSMHIVKYQLTNPRQFSVQDLTGMMPMYR